MNNINGQSFNGKKLILLTHFQGHFQRFEEEFIKSLLRFQSFSFRKMIMGLIAYIENCYQGEDVMYQSIPFLYPIYQD